MTVFGRTILGSASAASAAGAKANAAQAGGKIQQFSTAYYNKYIATSSIKPVIHLIGGFSLIHWSITKYHKSKYQSKRVYH